MYVNNNCVFGRFYLVFGKFRYLWFVSLFSLQFYTKMKVTDILANNTKKTLVSFEILPPLKGKSIDAITKILDPLMEFNPPFIKGGISKM